MMSRRGIDGQGIEGQGIDRQGIDRQGIDRFVCRLAFGAPVGLAAYAVTSHVALLAGWPLPVWWFPVVVAAGLACAAWRAAPFAPAVADRPARSWHAVPFVTAAILLFAVSIVTYGAVATGDREWDGLVSWGVRAKYLMPPADLAQPFFADPAVYAHSVGYPLLQPLCLGACEALLGELPGRLFFPAVFVAYLLLLAAAGREASLPRGHGWLLVLACGTTPMWFSTGSGAVDSGYAELLLAYFLAVGAAGLLTGRAALLASAAVCLPLVKPEGLPYAALLACVTAVTGSGRRLHAAATLGLALGAALWLPLQAHLLSNPGPRTWLVPLGLAVVLPVIRELQLRVAWRLRVWIAIAAAVASVLGGLLAVTGEVQPSASPLLREFSGIGELPARFRALPTLLLGYVEGFLFVRKVGLLFPMVLFLLCWRPAWSTRQPHRPLALLFGCGLVTACAAIFLGADTDWDHVFESRFDRLLLQWTGAGWLLLGPWLSGLFRDAAAHARE